MMKIYLDKTVLEASLERIEYIFDHFENIVVSVSSGKDSTVIYHLALDEAIKRNRKIKVMFLDQEAEYENTVLLMRKQMNHSNVIPMWFQVPIYMTNATSYKEDQLYAWGEGEEWIRDKEPNSIHSIEGDYPKRFYKFFPWVEKNNPDTAFIIGLRAEESLNRYRAVTKNPGYDNIRWSTKTECPTTFRFYPIYDWGAGDVWKYIDDNNIEYNKIYDLMFANNHNIYNTMRVSNLIHEKSFRCLTDLQKLEPNTYNKLCKRLEGVHVASRYANEDTIYSANERPKDFKTWKEYRDYLLLTSTSKHKDRFIKRFEEQGDDEVVCKQQCKQILVNDWENVFTVDTKKKKKRKATLDKWRAIL